LPAIAYRNKPALFFIITADNKACHIILDNGRVTAMFHGQLRGEKLAGELPFIKLERFSFKCRITTKRDSCRSKSRQQQGK